MARGRTFFTEHRRRAASVPVGDLSYPSVTTASQVYNIAKHVAHDTDDLLSASKRHDRDFLHDIQNKLAYSAVARQPVTLDHKRPVLVKSYHNYSRAPAASIKYGGQNQRVGDSRRRTWYGPTSSPVDDYEVAEYLAKPIHTPFHRSIRSGSVPPVLPSSSRWYSSGGHRGATVPHWGTAGVYRPLANKPGYGRSYLTNHPHMEDVVVGVAPTTYGDILIGIPHKKAFMFNAQHGLDEVGYHPHAHLPTRVTSPYLVTPTLFVSRSRPLLQSSYDDFDDLPRRRHTFSAAPSVHATSTSSRWLPTGHHGDSGSTISYLRPLVQHTRATPYYDLDLYSSKAPSGESFSNLRARASHARDKVNEHKTMLDRYTPVTHSPVDASLTRSRSAGTNPTFLPSSASSSGSAAAASSGHRHAASVPFKPKISDTRQRVRELLCKSKNDPHYFD